MQVFSNPNLDGPNFEFRDGQTTNGRPEVPNSYPPLGLPQSAWHIQQWHKSEGINPAAVSLYSPSTYDLLFGPATYSWMTNDQSTGLSAYNGPGPGRYTYSLIGHNGAFQPLGGANIFLENTSPQVTATFDHPITYSLLTRITEAASHYDQDYYK